MIWSFASMILFLPGTILAINFLTKVSREKEQRLRINMELMYVYIYKTLYLLLQGIEFDSILVSVFRPEFYHDFYSIFGSMCSRRSFQVVSFSKLQLFGTSRISQSNFLKLIRLFFYSFFFMAPL